MPGGDGTGPMGAGPMTGRAAGYCAGYGVPGYMNPWPGGGRGFWRFGRGFGRGYRHWYWATGVPGWTRFGGYWPGAAVPWYGQPVSAGSREGEAEDLKAQASELESELQAIRERISELESKSET